MRSPSTLIKDEFVAVTSKEAATLGKMSLPQLRSLLHRVRRYREKHATLARLTSRTHLKGLASAVVRRADAWIEILIDMIAQREEAQKKAQRPDPNSPIRKWLEKTRNKRAQPRHLAKRRYD